MLLLKVQRQIVGVCQTHFWPQCFPGTGNNIEEVLNFTSSICEHIVQISSKTREYYYFHYIINKKLCEVLKITDDISVERRGLFCEWFLTFYSLLLCNNNFKFPLIL